MSLDSYNTPSTTSVYINGNKVDEMFRVDWQDKSAKTPLYGWADKQYRAIANGRELVTGSLILHYRYPGYLFTALNSFGNGVNGTVTSNRDKENLRNSLHTLQQGTAEDRTQLLMKIAESGDLENFDKHALLLNTMLTDSPQTAGLLNGRDRSRKKYTTPSQLDAGSGPFSINIVYGSPDQHSFYVEKVIEGVQFLGESQTISASASGGGDMSSSGSPIFEVYTFLAKTVTEQIHEPPTSFQSDIARL